MKAQQLRAIPNPKPLPGERKAVECPECGKRIEGIARYQLHFRVQHGM